MANYWDTYNPGLLAGEDYWENFTPEAPTETGVVGKVTGRRYQPWEKGYHKIAGLVDNSGDYDAWYDPDPPPETSAPDWATPEGYDNWKTRIGLDTGNNNNNNNQNTGDNTYIGPEGSEGEGRIDLSQADIDAIRRAQGGDNSIDLSDLSFGKALLGFGMAGPLGGVMGLFSNQINDAMSGILDGSFFKDIFSGSDTEVAPATDTGQGDPMGGTIG
tara:strand:- start:1369 stop:2016 length:648 start_codon:yes stop_codon:yes gene_type:complete